MIDAIQIYAYINKLLFIMHTHTCKYIWVCVVTLGTSYKQIQVHVHQAYNEHNWWLKYIRLIRSTTHVYEYVYLKK